MPGWAIRDFGGEIPRQDPRLLANNMAQNALNVDLNSGAMEGLPQPEFIIDLSSKAPWPVRKAYLCFGLADDPPVWMPLPSEFSSVVPSPLTNDTQHRYYWTNPQGQPAAGAWWSTYADIAAGNPPWNMGFTAPDPSIVLSVTAVGGTPPPNPPEIERSYVFTYIDNFGAESSPTEPSPVVAGPPDATWTVTGFPLTAPSSPAGFNYAPVNRMRLYRTITGSSTGANFFYVADIPFGTTSYVDTQPDTLVSNNNTLTTPSFNPPPPDLDGLIAFPGGMLMAFTGNTIHFCEPDLPHAWPAAYDASVYYPIMALAVWQTTLVVITRGYPANGSGTTPASFYFSQINVPEPCISRGSVITDLAGVYYASENGLVMLNYFGMQNQTLSNMTKNLWLTEYDAANIVACRHRAQYLAINRTGQGFIIDYAEARLGIVHIIPLINTVSVFNEPRSGDAYMCADGQIWLWDSPNTPPLMYRWKSKEFYQPLPISLGAVQVSMEAPSSTMPPSQGRPPPMADIPGLSLPPGIPAVFNLYVGVDGNTLVHSQPMTQTRSVFRLPSGRKAFNWQCEIISIVRVHSIEMATTMKELRKV